MEEPNEPFFDFGLPKIDRTPIRIRTTRSMFIRVIGEAALLPVAEGEEVTITMHDARSMSPESY